TDLSPEEIAASHRWHAIECNNRAWQLSEQPRRSPAENEQMLHAAHAAAFHWAQVGTELHQARARMLLGHVCAAVGQGQPALAYAGRSLAYLAAHETPDWEIAFAHAVLAHAASAAGGTALHREHYTRAQELGHAIADPEDKAIFHKTFDLIPAP
ncbi:MAG: hypothetical protein ABIL09_08980, partial [Gemmatimonadota bacterium]